MNPRFPYRKLLQWFEDHARDLPWRVAYLPYEVVVSEMMLQQTQIVTMVPYYIKWMKRFPDWKCLAKQSEEEVLKHWSGLGYYQRARNLHKLSKVIVDEYKGRLPNDRELLKKLPGIGPYSSGAICAIAFDLPELPFDGNIRRVLSRFYANDAISPSDEQDRKFEELILPLMQKHGQNRHFVQALMELGALICTPKALPECELCPLKANCRARAVDKVLAYPFSKARKAPKPLHLNFLLGHDFQWKNSAETKTGKREVSPFVGSAKYGSR